MKFTKKPVLKSFIWLAVIGILISLYLLQNHYAPATEGSFCDFTDNVSCSLVNTSEYSEFFSVPVSLFGALWFFVFALMAWSAMKHDGVVIVMMLLWSLLGFAFILYMVTAEILLKAICPFCTVLHVFILYILYATYKLFKQEKKVSQKKLIGAAKGWIFFILVLYLIPTVIFNVGGEEQDYTEFAQCLTENNMKMYGSFRCGICAKTRAMFGDAFEHIIEYECHPDGEDPRTERCQEINVIRTPMWVVEEADGTVTDKSAGFTSPKKLAEMSGCSLDLIKQN